jgi:penicillin-binding protein 2
MNKEKVFPIYIFILFIAVVFIARLAYLQLITDRYILNAFNTSIKEEIIRPQRGYIFDRNQKLMVSNSSTYELTVTPKLIKANFDTIHFCHLVGISKIEFIKKLEAARNFSPYLPSPLISYLPKETVAKIQEKIYRFPQFELRKMTQRDYHSNGGSNVLGYIGEAGIKLIESDPSYSRGDFIGISGVEKSYEEFLRGTKGIKYHKVDLRGRIIGKYNEGEDNIHVKSGTDITITIDAELQTYAEELMRNKRGGIVAIEPKTGEILTMVSSPVVDPHLFIGSDRQKNVIKLLNDSMNNSLFDRSVKAQYPPGSTFKIVTALAAFQMGVTDTASTFVCTRGFRTGRRLIGCHCGAHYRPLSIKTAIQKSCNAYFLHTYKKILQKDSTKTRKNLEDWNKIMYSFGLGNYLNNDLSTGNKGFIPTAEYYDKIYGKDRWNPYTIIYNGMGQGEVLTTPLQLANIAAIIANRGFYITPHIIKKIGNTTKEIDKKLLTKKRVPINSKHFTPIIQGLEMVVSNGTAYGIRTKDFTQAGKTGTAENPHGQDHSIFIMFAPVNNPKIAISVMIENGHYGATWAAPIASLIAEKYLKREVKRKYLEDRMKNGGLQSEYKRQWINHLKKIGRYRELIFIPDSIKRDSLEKIMKKLALDSIQKTSNNKKNTPQQKIKNNTN